MSTGIKLFVSKFRRSVINFLHKHPRIAEAIEKWPPSHTFMNKQLINSAVTATAARPQAYTLWTPRPIKPNPIDVIPGEPPVDYISLPGLVNRRFTGRHLPPAPVSYNARLPDLDKVLALYQRQDFIPSSTCSALLCFFAQWFTDSFLRKDPYDERLNTSNHEIDLCQIYGLDAETARTLRFSREDIDKDPTKKGKLRTSPDGRFPERLFGPDGNVKSHFLELPYIKMQMQTLTQEEYVLRSLGGGWLDKDKNTLAKARFDQEVQNRRSYLYATGLERGNSTVFYTAISTIFIREHNRLCDLLAAEHPDWDDDRLFETARNINIVMGLNLTINEYINQLSRPPVKLRLDRSFAEKKPWYRANRIAIEFSLLYRWHSFVPDTIEIDGTTLQHTDYRFNNAVLEKYGAAALIAAASQQPGGQIGIGNNPDFLYQAELNAHTFARSQRVRPFVEYQAAFGLTPVGSFEELTSDKELAAKLYKLYNGEIRDVELLVGLFAQERDMPEKIILPLLLRVMVAVDAFSQILTNPLVSENVYGPDAFSAEGMKVIEETTSFDMLVARNRMGEDYPNPASFAYPPPAAATLH
jgi:prostaglandin-endoperoxide synthase 2